MSWQNAGNDEVEVDFWKLEGPSHLRRGTLRAAALLSCCGPAALLGRDPGEQEFRSYNSAAFQLASPSARQADGATGRGTGRRLSAVKFFVTTLLWRTKARRRVAQHARSTTTASPPSFHTLIATAQLDSDQRVQRN